MHIKHCNHQLPEGEYEDSTYFINVFGEIQKGRERDRNNFLSS